VSQSTNVFAQTARKRLVHLDTPTRLHNRAPEPKTDPAVDDSVMLVNERIWMLKRRPAMFDREMDVQHFEREG
jgi:hypothetical protein